jgi:hypothetical protein
MISFAIDENEGTAGQVLASNGAGNSVRWTNIIDQDAGLIPIPNIPTVGIGSTSEITLTPITRAIETPVGTITRLFISCDVSGISFGCTGIGCFPAIKFRMRVDGVEKFRKTFETKNLDILNMVLANIPVDVAGGLHFIEFSIQKESSAVNDFSSWPIGSSVLAIKSN